VEAQVAIVKVFTPYTIVKVFTSYTIVKVLTPYQGGLKAHQVQLHEVKYLISRYNVE
jgi:hypothetical protein